jgi:polar amino acid transport system substrate-binding protein
MGVLTALFAACRAAADPLPVSLVTDDNHFPYAFLDQGKPAGIYVKIIEVIAARMPDYQVKIAALPWKRALRMTETGDASGIFPPHYFPIERPYLDLYSDSILTEIPVLQCNEQVLAAHGIDRRKAVWPDGYARAGLTVAAPMGTHMGGDKVRAQLATSGIAVIASAGIMENMREVAYGRVACLINDRVTVRAAIAWLQKNDPHVPLSWVVEAVAFPAEDGHLALSSPAALREPYHAAFLAEFNAHLNALRANGSLDEIVEAYLRQINS